MKGSGVARHRRKGQIFKKVLVSWYPTPLASPRPADVRSAWVPNRAAGRGDRAHRFARDVPVKPTTPHPRFADPLPAVAGRGRLVDRVSRDALAPPGREQVRRILKEAGPASAAGRACLRQIDAL